MSLIIEKEEAMQLLRANVKHYLWNKHYLTLDCCRCRKPEKWH